MKFAEFWTQPQLEKMLGYWKNKEGSCMADLLDLLTRMMVTDPQQRITIQQVLEHPWFKGPIVTTN